jgi:hypothetical protein
MDFSWIIELARALRIIALADYRRSSAVAGAFPKLRNNLVTDNRWAAEDRSRRRTLRNSAILKSRQQDQTSARDRPQ